MVIVLSEIVCSECGKTDHVPFTPTGDRPVYCQECCQECYQKRKGF
ncbi:CxxC-x17-CxxC domain-containing protein [Thermoproteota archaeon]